eukprot:SAG31_NODE_47052_length_251_cov_83.243421_1_plen_21_part_01
MTVWSRLQGLELDLAISSVPL